MPGLGKLTPEEGIATAAYRRSAVGLAVRDAYENGSDYVQFRLSHSGDGNANFAGNTVGQLDPEVVVSYTVR